MAKVEARTIYEKDGIRIQIDSYNWILLVKGKEPAYFGTIEGLLDSLMQEKLKTELKENFINLKAICDGLKEEVREIVGAMIKSPKK